MILINLHRPDPDPTFEKILNRIQTQPKHPDHNGSGSGIMEKTNIRPPFHICLTASVKIFMQELLTYLIAWRVIYLFLGTLA